MNTSRMTNPASSSVNDSGIPVKVQFRHMDESKRVIWLVNQMMHKFTKFPIAGASAHVTVDETHHKEKTGIFQVKMKLTVPGEKLYTAQSSEKTGMHDGVYSALADVFDSVERQLVRHHEKRSRRYRAREKAA
ncbi:HPF/RaiA family ribosome-associated protein [Pontiella sp.]|uniref:HPF/RaiA family ribosome-associated protein n=1 Tax=Pontiella sp. TaxID=2837462 RepID=UPI003563A4D4